MQEIGVYELGCTVRVDELGFFICWKSDGKVGAMGCCCCCCFVIVRASVAQRHHNMCLARAISLPETSTELILEVITARRVLWHVVGM